MPIDPLRMGPKKSLGIFKGLGDVLDKRAGRQQAAQKEQERLEDRVFGSIRQGQRDVADEEMRTLEKALGEERLTQMRLPKAPPLINAVEDDGTVRRAVDAPGVRVQVPEKPARNIDPNSPEGIKARLEFERQRPDRTSTPRPPRPAAPAEFEKKAAFMLEGAVAAAKTLDDYTPTPRTWINKVPGAGNYGLGEGDQVALQAAETLHDAYLRLTTGATVTPDELRRAALQYVPSPGDGPQVLVKKRERRAQILRALQSAASTVQRPGQPAAAPAKATGGDPEFEALLAKYAKPPV